MRFQSLQIPAFGPFTNLDHQFPDQPADLHVIYGPNEAGKSSLLRAIRDLLFGIHAQSPDGFLHDYGDLRIKGEIRSRAGEHLVFQRRKGNKNTLLDAEGRQLPDHALFPFLGSVDPSYFSAMFGLGARELREGAEQLLRGEGDLGTALFSASLGGTPVQKVVEALQEETDRIFNGRAIKDVSIRPAAKQYKELLAFSRDAMVNPDRWDRIEKDLSEAESVRKRLEEEILRLDLELHWITRCEDALPTVAQLGEENQTVAQLPPLPDLASDFAPRVQAARQALGEAQSEVQRLTVHIAKLRTQLAGCPTAAGVLAEADALDLLHQDLGAYRDRKKSLGNLTVALEGLEPQLRTGMANLQFTGDYASLENHRLSTPVRLACEESARSLKEAWAEQTVHSGKAEELAHQIRVLETQLQSLPEADLSALRDALAVAAEATDADRTFTTSEAEVQRLTRETVDQHRLLAGAPADLSVTAGLPVPTPATLHRFRDQLGELRRDIKTQEARVIECTQGTHATQAELARLQRQGELPSEESLHKSRKRRDHGWSLVLAEWKGVGTHEELLPGSPLEEAFPKTIAIADSIADQLRLDAEAVAQAEEKRLHLDELAIALTAAQQRIASLQTAWDDCQKAWEAEWSACGITPRTPVEMEEWRNQWTSFRDRFSQFLNAQESFQRKHDQIQRARNRLAPVLGQPEEKEFRLLFAEARKRVQEGEQSAGQRILMSQQIAALKADLAKRVQSHALLSDKVRDATGKWVSRCAAVGLPEGTSPDAGLILLRERAELLAQFDEWRKSSIAAQSIAQLITQSEGAVREKAVALGLVGDTIEAMESALWKALSEARKAQARHDQLAEQIGVSEADLEEARLRVAQAEQTLGELIRLAGLGGVDELEPLLAHLEQRNAVQARIHGLRTTLSGLARGQAVDDFVTRVRAEDPDALAARKAAATQGKLEKETALPGVRDTLFGLRNEKSALEKAGDAAADFRQQAESCAATLRQDAARFLRLGLAIHFLKAQIERFRKENQGPLLLKSGEVFRAMTRGAFIGLGADFNADDEPVLVGVRHDQARVPVEGLSDGSRDQLYLALRLAALDRYLEEHEPMPLILDDLLITFDDDRAKAILPQLGALAGRTQVFLFTHHGHLVELCRQTLGESRFHLHRLG